MNSKEMPICSTKDVEELVGKILTLVEFGIEDKNRLEAGKTIIKRTIYDWHDKLPGYTTLLKGASELGTDRTPFLASEEV